MTWVELRTLLTIFIMLIVPGWAILSVTNLWRRFEAIERCILAVGLSIAFYPFVYYLTRAILPSVRIGQNKLIVLLAGLFALTAWTLRKNWREQFKLGKYAGPFLFILALTLLTRFWLAHNYPYPAWTDSLHHMLITDLVATTGKLPFDLQPYAPTTLDQYHLGLYALTGSLQVLADIPAHQALLWMAQALNGLCGLGVFLFLSKRVSPLAGLAGMAVVGLFSFQPALYFSWGRFTQVSSQTILLIAAFATWEAIRAWKGDWKGNRNSALALTGISALLIAGVFLLHFRAAAFLLPLLVILCIYEFAVALKTKMHAMRMVIGIAAIALVSVVLILPALVPAMEFYVDQRSTPAETADLEPSKGLEENQYFSNYNIDSLYAIGAKKWLIGLTLLSMLVGLLRKNRVVIFMMTAWILALFGIGLLYRLNIPLLAFTNMTGMMIMLYLPIGVIVGVLAEDLWQLFSLEKHENWRTGLQWAVLFLAVVAAIYRLGEVEGFRQFMTPADEKAMDWIEKNTPKEAVFAVHTYYWLPDSPHGSDAGYFIPYYANRETTTSTMISSLGPGYEEVMAESEAVMSLYSPSPDIGALCELGVDYLYDGAKNPFDGSQFNLSAIQKAEGVQTIYQDGGVSIFKL
ncbi:MAG TPA: hypothetical protein PLE00_08660, partial [Anaerolineaceae bacterium]|nr:hypothetical protein [Anaerolineaceae bacterium]